MRFCSSALSQAHPSQFGACFAYWTADNVSLSGGTVITKIFDQSGNKQSARDLAQVGTGPSYVGADSRFNGQPSISSRGTNDRVQAAFDVSLTQAYTVYHVINVATNGATMFWRTNAGNFTDSAGFYVNTGTPTVSMLTLDSAQAITSVGTISNGTHVTCCVYDSTGGASAVYVDNSKTAFAKNPGEGNVNTNSCAVMTVGNFGTANSYAWSSLACYRGAHTGAEREAIMKWLGNRYGVTVTG